MNESGIQLTAADCFMNALEEHMIGREEGSTNVCHYVLELEGKLDPEKFKQQIQSNKSIRQLASFQPFKPNIISLPVWKEKKHDENIPIKIHDSDELIPLNILNQKIKITEHQLRFDLLYRSNGNTTIIFSWHHLIMDGYGAVLLLRKLAENSSLDDCIITNRESATGKFLDAAKAKFFIDRSSRWPISSISPKKKLFTETRRVKTFVFDAEQMKTLDRKGLKLGARYGRSPLYLSAAARSIYKILKSRGEKIHDFWIPVPKDLRKKGADGPLLGNHTSFLFYRLEHEILNSFEETVASTQRQMIDQLKNGTSNNYDFLMHYLRRTPTPLYYFWIKGLRGGTIASFLFTVAADHPEDFQTFQGQQILSAWSFPSGVFPPGLSFAFMKFKNQLQLMVNYFEGVVNEQEVESIGNSILQDLFQEI